MSITYDLVPTDAAASAVYVEQKAVKRSTGSAVIPRKVLVPGNYNTGFSPVANVAQKILSKEDAWDRYGRGSMLALMIEHIIDNDGGVEVYGLPVAQGTGAAAGSLAFTGTATKDGTIFLYVGGKLIPVAVSKDDAAADVAEAVKDAINADLDLPVTATASTGTVTVTSRFSGLAGNQIVLALNSDDESLPAGIGCTVTAITGGTVDPDLEDAFAGLGNTWFTDIAMPFTSAAALAQMEAAGEDRDDPGVKRQFAGFVGMTGSLSDYTTALEGRNSQWTTYVPILGSDTPAFMIAAAAAAEFAQYQQATPGRPMKGLTIPDVRSASANDLTKAQREALVKAGGSHTYNQEDGTVTIGDLCTTRTKTAAGAATTDWRFTIIIPNIQFKIYSLDQCYLSSPFDRAVVAKDGGAPKPSYAVTPKVAKGFAIKLVDDWIKRGLSTDRENIVKNITAEIDGSNAGRINLLIPDVPSAGLRILAAKLEWAFVA